MTKRYIHCICPKHPENMKIGVYIHLVNRFFNPCFQPYLDGTLNKRI